jgi:hypothetical protein
MPAAAGISLFAAAVSKSLLVFADVAAAFTAEVSSCVDAMVSCDACYLMRYAIVSPCLFDVICVGVTVRRSCASS